MVVARRWRALAVDVVKAYFTAGRSNLPEGLLQALQVQLDLAEVNGRRAEARRGAALNRRKRAQV